MLGVKYNNTTSCKIDGWLRSKIDEGSEHKEFTTGEGEKKHAPATEKMSNKKFDTRDGVKEVRKNGEG